MEIKRLNLFGYFGPISKRLPGLSFVHKWSTFNSSCLDLQHFMQINSETLNKDIHCIWSMNSLCITRASVFLLGDNAKKIIKCMI